MAKPSEHQKYLIQFKERHPTRRTCRPWRKTPGVLLVLVTRKNLIFAVSVLVVELSVPASLSVFVYDALHDETFGISRHSP